MKTYRILVLGAVGSSLILVHSIFAAELAPSDVTFMEKAAQGGMTEVELGKLAEKRAEKADIKEYGAMMVRDHSKVDDELAKLAEKKNVKLVKKPNAKEQAAAADLEKLTGADFDKRYVSMMVEDHKKDVAEFEEASKTLADPDLKAFAEKTLPILKKHLAKIEKIQDAK